jgi:prenyltransferase beta subunit
VGTSLLTRHMARTESDVSSCRMEGNPLLRGINHDVVAFVMARWLESGGFGFAPTLPASVEATYRALRILETIWPVSEREMLGLRENPHMKAFLLRNEDKETWSLRTAYQYLYLCSLCKVSPEQGWLERILEQRLKEALSLRDRYYLVKILRECPDAPSIDCNPLLEGGATEKWRTVEDLWMCFYLHQGLPEALRTTGEAIVEWVQACQNPDGGFGCLPGTTSFIENSRWCLRSLAMLGGRLLSTDMTEDFILRCKTSGGGFARKSGAAPFLDSTWHAVASLFLLRMPPQIFKGTYESVEKHASQVIFNF